MADRFVSESRRHRGKHSDRAQGRQMIGPVTLGHLGVAIGSDNLELGHRRFASKRSASRDETIERLLFARPAQMICTVTPPRIVSLKRKAPIQPRLDRD
jgi:hypothetical protein